MALSRVFRVVGFFLLLSICCAFQAMFFRDRGQGQTNLFSFRNHDRTSLSKVILVGGPPHMKAKLTQALCRKGFEVLPNAPDLSEDAPEAMYSWNAATGMLQLRSSPPTTHGLSAGAASFPKWVPVVQEQENVLVANGWSFLDTDDSEPMSSFDVDAANKEGTYQPKWKDKMTSGDPSRSSRLSSLGFSIDLWSVGQINNISAQRLQTDRAKRVLWEGATDPRGEKWTHNGFDLNGSLVKFQQDGIFTCALTHLPLFASTDLMPTTGSSGWLSFSRPLANDHITLVQPEPGALDLRTEVLCGSSRCHLGHYFGPGEGFCINTSVLNFIPLETDALASRTETLLDGPISYLALERSERSPLTNILKRVIRQQIKAEKVVLGAGCFWHVEFALRRLPGVISTVVGYAGGDVDHPSYQQVCEGNTGHAEVVLLEFDPNVLSPRKLLDCFLALHHPTKVRAHGKHAQYTGQYRSCVFLTNHTLESCVQEALSECREQLDKDIVTQLQVLGSPLHSWFWVAEDRHQRHDERDNTSPSDTCTLDPVEWLKIYGRRKDSIVGSAKTLDEAVAETRFMI